MIGAAALLGALAWAWAAGAEGLSPAAGAAVSSREWRMRRVPEREEEFIGDVRARRGPTLVTADWALYRHRGRLWSIRGSIRALHHHRSGDRIEARGERAVYDMERELGRLEGAAGGEVELELQASDGGRDFARARLAEWEAARRLALVGGVRLWGSHGSARADRAELRPDPWRVSLTGSRPMLRVLTARAEAALQGDRVDLVCGPGGRTSLDRVRASGRVRGWIAPRPTP